MKPGRPSRYRIEVGLLTEFNDNLFEEDLDDDDCCEEELILTSSARFEAELYRREKSRVKGFARARYHTHNEENDADYADLDVGLRLRHDAHKLGLTYFATPDRPRFREDVSTTTHGVETVLSSELADVVVGELSYEFAHEQYASHESTAEAREKTRGKTNDSHTISTDLRYELTAWIAPSIGFEFEQEDAKDNSENRNEYAPAFALRSFVLDRLYLEMRYRWRYRDYYGNRVDRRNQLDIYANLQLAEHWFLFAFYTFADNSSNSEGDDFRQNDTGLGLSWRWP